MRRLLSRVAWTTVIWATFLSVAAVAGGASVLAAVRAAPSECDPPPACLSNLDCVMHTDCPYCIGTFGHKTCQPK